MKSLKSFWSKMRLPHALTLLFLIVIIMGVISLILSYAGVLAGDKVYQAVDQEWTEAGSPTKIIEGITYKADAAGNALIDRVKSKAIFGAGILDWFTAIPAGIWHAIWIIIFLFVLGGFINVVIKSQSLEALIGKVSRYFPKEFKKISSNMRAKSLIHYYFALIKEGLRQTWVIIPLMLFFSFAGTSYGMAEESLAFYGIIIPLALAAGFDTWTGFLIIFVGAGVGVMGSTINPFSTLTAVDAVKKEGVNALGGEAWRWVSWVFFTIVTIIFVMIYAARVKMNKNNSAMKDLFEVHEKMFTGAHAETAPPLTKRRLITSIIFLFTFVVMVLGMLGYDSIIAGEKSFEGPTSDLEYGTFADNNSLSWLHNNQVTTKMADYKIFNLNKFEYGDSEAWVLEWTFGYFYLGTLAAYFFMISLIIAFINWKSEKNYVEEMVDGAKDMMGVALAVGVARGVAVILKSTNMEILFSNGIANAIKNVETGKEFAIPILSYILFIPLTFIIPSTSGLASATFPILGPAIEQVDPDLVSETITSYAWGAGLANMVVPTYGVVIGALAVTKIPFEKFVRGIWKYLLLMFLVGLVMIVLGAAVATSNPTIF